MKRRAHSVDNSDETLARDPENVDPMRNVKLIGKISQFLKPKDSATLRAMNETTREAVEKYSPGHFDKHISQETIDTAGERGEPFLVIKAFDAEIKRLDKIKEENFARARRGEPELERKLEFFYYYAMEQLYLNNKTDAVLYLLDNGLSPDAHSFERRKNSKEKGRTLIYAAILKDDIDFINDLIDLGATLDWYNEDYSQSKPKTKVDDSVARAAGSSGMTRPVYSSQGSGGWKREDQEYFKARTYKETPLTYAINLKKKEIVKHLIEEGADPEYGPVERPMSLAQKYAQSMLPVIQAAVIKKRGEAANHPISLHNAIDQEDLTEVNFLISSGADINSIYQNTTPLLRAVAKGFFKGVELLLDKGAWYHKTEEDFARASSSDKRVNTLRQTPPVMQAAIMSKDLSMIRLLKKKLVPVHPSMVLLALSMIDEKVVDEVWDAVKDIFFKNPKSLAPQVLLTLNIITASVANTLKQTSDDNLKDNMLRMLRLALRLRLPYVNSGHTLMFHCLMQDVFDNGEIVIGEAPSSPAYVKPLPKTVILLMLDLFQEYNYEDETLWRRVISLGDRDILAKYVEMHPNALLDDILLQTIDYNLDWALDVILEMKPAMSHQFFEELARRATALKRRTAMLVILQYHRTFSRLIKDEWKDDEGISGLLE